MHYYSLDAWNTMPVVVVEASYLVGQKWQLWLGVALVVVPIIGW